MSVPIEMRRRAGAQLCRFVTWPCLCCNFEAEYDISLRLSPGGKSKINAIGLQQGLTLATLTSMVVRPDRTCEAHTST
ncbi:hypothetical protein FQZ97_1176830 [compost metagenome]